LFKLSNTVFNLEVFWAKRNYLAVEILLVILLKFKVPVHRLNPIEVAFQIEVSIILRAFNLEVSKVIELAS